MASNAEIARKMYEDYFVHGDVDAVLEALDPAIEWAEPDLGALPYAGLTTGRDTVVANVFAKIGGVYEKLLFEPEVFYEAGDVVTVVGRCSVKGKGKPEERFPFAHVLRFREGRILRFDHFVDTNKIALTLGYTTIVR